MPKRMLLAIRARSEIIEMDRGPVEHSLVTAARSDDRQSKRTTVESAEWKTDLRQAREPRDRQQRESVGAEGLDFARWRVEPGLDSRRGRQTQHPVVPKQAVHVARHCL